LTESWISSSKSATDHNSYRRYGGKQNNMGTLRIVVPAQIIGDQDGQWDRKRLQDRCLLRQSVEWLQSFMRTWHRSSKTAATAVIVFLAACVGSPRATAVQLERSELYIAISEVRTEHSRDTYSITKTVSVKNGVLTYDESSRRKKPVHQEYNLTNDELKRLETLVVERKLLTSKSISGAEASGPHMSLDLSVETRLRKNRGSIKISGAETEELKTNQVYKNAKALLDMLADLTGSTPAPGPFFALAYDKQH